MELLNILSLTIGIIGIVVITWGVLLVVIEFLRVEINHLRKRPPHKKEQHMLRQHLGSYILLGLEFMIAGDIIHTVIKPSKEALIVLGVIVIIRTVISFFLQLELKNRI